MPTPLPWHCRILWEERLKASSSASPKGEKEKFLMPKKRREMETSITFSVQPTTPACLDPKTIKPKQTDNCCRDETKGTCVVPFSSAAVLHFCRLFLFSRNASFLLSLFLGLPRHQASLGNRSECVVPDEYLHLSFPLLYGAVFARKERERKEKAISSFIV